MNRVNPEMLILARESRGMSQVELATKTKIAASILCRYETETLRPADHHLGIIAEALEYPTSFFYNEDKRYGFGSNCLYHRKRVSLPPSDLRKLQAKANIFRIRVSKLLKGAQVEAKLKFPKFDIGEYEGDVDHIANLVRAAWKLPMGPIKNLVELVEQAGGIVSYFPFETRKLDAISHWAPGGQPIFFLNSEMPADRCRFTLAHEIGHIVMHEFSTVDQEKEADRFASELLMPADEITKDLAPPLTLAKLAQLKPYWRVSMQALAVRAYHLEVISKDQYRRLFTIMSRMGYRLTEPVTIPREEPQVFSALISVYLSDHKYTIEELSKHLDVRDAEFRRDYLASRANLRLVK